MLLVADHPSSASHLGMTDVRPMHIGALPSEVRAIWRRLSTESTVSVGELPLEGRHSVPRPLLVVDHADGSQFTALQSALRNAVPMPPDLATVALTGSGFRGQRGRAWEALRGNLHLCVLARLELPLSEIQSALTALPAVAAVRAVASASGGRTLLRLKWVNDLMLSGRKIGGVLSATHVSGPLVSHLVTGIGINLARTPALERAASAPPAGSLAALSTPAPSLAHLTQALLTELDAAVAKLRAGAGAELVEAYRRSSAVVGRRVAIWPVEPDAAAGAPLVTGRVRALRADLALELDGHPEPVHAGRLTFLDGRDDLDPGAGEGT